MTHGEWLGGWEGFDCLGRAKGLTVKVRRMKIYIYREKCVQFEKEVQKSWRYSSYSSGVE